jgi:hypothetical protein
MEFYRVKNWERFQHYKDRSPPWIKRHFEIMTSQDWVMLADASKLLMVICMLVASRNEGKVPADPHYFKRVAYLDKLPDFKPLLNCGFLENPLADASESKQTIADARPETETYSTETEDKKKPPTEVKKKIGLDELSVDHVADWLSAQRVRGKYIGHDEHFVLDQFKNYCQSKGKRYDDYVAGYRNAFEWERCQPRAVTTGGGQPSKVQLAIEATERARAARQRTGPVET